MTTQPTVLQLCSFAPYFDAELKKRFEVVRWFELSDAEQSDWLMRRAGDVRAVATGAHVGCPNTLMAALPKLGLVAISGAGLDKVDLPGAQARGVRVSNTPGAPTEDTADLAVGLIISLLRGIPAADAHVRLGFWPKGDRPLMRKVTGSRFGIVGLGKIGSAVAARLAPFGHVAYTGPHKKPVSYEYHSELLSLARASDVLVVTCPANAATRRLVGPAALAALGSRGYLVNVARGAVVDEAALIAALGEGVIAGAALDVFENEPHVPEELRASSRVVLTPHMASATHETRTRMADGALANLDAFFAGRELPTAVV